MRARTAEIRFAPTPQQAMELRYVQRMCGRAMNASMAHCRSCDVERLPYLPDPMPTKKYKGKVVKDYKAAFGQFRDVRRGDDAEAVTIYQYTSRLFPMLHTSTVTSLNQLAMKKWIGCRISVLGYGDRMPQYDDEHPIVVKGGRGRSAQWTMRHSINTIADAEGRKVRIDSYTVSFKLGSKKSDMAKQDYPLSWPRANMPDHFRDAFDRYCDDDEKRPAITVKLRRKRTASKSKWMMFIPVMLPDVELVASDRVMEVYPPDDGSEFLIAKVIKPGRPWTTHLPWFSAASRDQREAFYEQQKRNAFHRKQIQNTYGMDLDVARRGRGRARALAPLIPFRKKMGFMRSWNGHWSRKIVDLAVKQRVGTVKMMKLSAVEDKSNLVLGDWDYFGLQQIVGRRCEDAGISFELLEPVSGDAFNAENQEQKCKVKGKGKAKPKRRSKTTTRRRRIA